MLASFRIQRSDGPAIGAGVLRRLSDHARLRLNVVDDDGRTIDLGTAHRSPTTSQLHALWRRDRGCTVPGCGRTRFLHAHHVVHWARGGETRLDNLTLLCGEHHRSLHEGGFTITAQGRQTFVFRDPDGTVRQSAPSMEGRLGDLTARHSTIGPEAIASEWDGSPLESYAFTGYLVGWEQALQRERSASA
jgi:hypothetical protein